MKKRFLLASAAALIMAGNVSAQTDITPSRYKFSNQEVGLYQIDYVMQEQIRQMLYRQ